MNIHFNLHYKTEYGENIGIEYSPVDQPEKIRQLTFHTFDGENWTGMLTKDDLKPFNYRYILIKDHEVIRREWGKYRTTEKSDTHLIVRDFWRPRDSVQNAFLSTAFTKAILKRKTQNAAPELWPTHNISKIIFKLESSTVSPKLCFGITGNIPELGDWKSARLLNDHNFPEWSTSILTDKNEFFIEYKFVIMDPISGHILTWEEGDNRKFYIKSPYAESSTFVVTDDHFRHKMGAWRGSGVAVPVFSLRSESGLGIGEFTDLKLLTDWADSIGFNVIQVLPVNDTIATKTWIDSYPYAAISVFGLHPLYVNIPAIARIKDAKVEKEYTKTQQELNQLPSVDFEKVLKAKFKFLKVIFDQEYEAFKKDKEALEFIETNRDWLPHYALFCHLRDKNKSSNFNQWKEHTVFEPQLIDDLCQPGYKDFREIEFYYFIQYHAHKQLREARDYGRSKSIALKGDLPIGIYRYSCDAWVAPSLYNMDGQAGAPPDDYSALGQNWGFPTYNWEEMSKDGFKWWQRRMQHLNRYFDALRIDHILGFFRIWQIPTDQVMGTMGLFNPRLPVSRMDLQKYGITGDLTPFITPWLTEDLLTGTFGSDTGEIFDTFFQRDNNGKIIFKTRLNTQLKIRKYLSRHNKFADYEPQLFNLLSEVLLLDEPDSKGRYFNPRITLKTTFAFHQLDQYTATSFENLYNDYFFTRHTEFWRKQALWKLPALLDASDMLICGEDLGMIPDSVPGVMRDMNILSLEIQRMPKGNSKYGMVNQYPYFSVCSPSVHDMSTIRGWWEADHNMAKDFYYNYLHRHGLPPMECTTDIVEEIIGDHLASPSMLAIFPIQDLIGIDNDLRNPVASSEQINEPSNPHHYWKFRFHLTLEKLLASTELNSKIRELNAKNGR